MATPTPYGVLAHKRAGVALDDDEIKALVAGAADGSWGDAQIGAFLMAAAIRGLDLRETRSLTREMLHSGDLWDLRAQVPTVGDKHSTGGVGDKVSLVLGPLLAACDQPVVMLTGRGLGHTAGTADKLESVPGLRLDLDRERSLDMLERTALAIGMATTQVAPADRRFYSIRDVTATVDSQPLIVASILSKKLAAGPAAVAFDLKTGDGAIIQDLDEGRRLARLLVDIAAGLGTPASALITDMSQPLGRWAGHAAEVQETLDCLEGRGAPDLMEVTYRLCEEVGALLGRPLERARLETAISSGDARRAFDRWAEAQGAEASWLRAPELPLAPHEVVLTAPRSGALQAVACRRIGLLLSEAGGGRQRPGDIIDPGISLLSTRRLGDEVTAGEELARLYLRRPDDELVSRFQACYTVADEGSAPPLIRERVGS